MLYLDSREKGSLLSTSTRGALETLATEAAVAIENARLYRETMEKARMEQEMRIAAEIQQALLPNPATSGAFFRTAAVVAAVPVDRRRLLRLRGPAGGAFGFALGDVAGKGPPAALLSAMMQGIFAAQAATSDPPSATITRVNHALYQRGIESRFVTLMFGSLEPDGRLTTATRGTIRRSSSAGRRPPARSAAGPSSGCSSGDIPRTRTSSLEPGDWLVVFSDGVSEALSADGEEFGDARIVASSRKHLRRAAEAARSALHRRPRVRQRRRAERRHHGAGAAVWASA